MAPVIPISWYSYSCVLSQGSLCNQENMAEVEYVAYKIRLEKTTTSVLDLHALSLILCHPSLWEKPCCKQLHGKVHVAKN